MHVRASGRLLVQEGTSAIGFTLPFVVAISVSVDGDSRYFEARIHACMLGWPIASLSRAS